MDNKCGEEDFYVHTFCFLVEHAAKVEVISYHSTITFFPSLI